MVFLVRRLLPLLLVLSCVLIYTVSAFAKRPYLADAALGAFGFAACELPCWAGMTPGETPFSKAFDLLVENVPALSTRVLVGGAQINFTATTPERSADGFIFDQQGQVGSVHVNLQLPLGQLVSRFGVPTCFIYHSDTLGFAGRLTLYWERDDALISALVLPSSGRLRLTSKVQALAINVGETTCDQEYTVPWLGFARLWRYAQAQGIPDNWRL